VDRTVPRITITGRASVYASVKLIGGNWAHLSTVDPAIIIAGITIEGFKK